MSKTGFNAFNLNCGFAIAMGLASLGLNACKTTTPAPPPPVISPTPTPVIIAQPTLPPPLNIPARPVQDRMDEALIRGAANHAVLMQNIVNTQTTTIDTPDQLNQMMDNLSQVYSPGMGPAFLSYGALIGAQNSAFVEGVLDKARYNGLDSVVYQLYSDLSYVDGFPGVELAANDIQTAWASDIAAISQSGAHVKQQSYDVQTKPKWKKMRADDRMERIYTVGQAQTRRFSPPAHTRQSLAEIGTLREYDNEADQKRQKFWRNYGRVNAPQSQTFTSQYNNNAMNRRALTLAALEILGASGEPSHIWIDGYTATPALNQCTKTARLNVEQCLAAGHFKYEDAFCVAQHELTEVSNCLTQSLF